MTLLLLLLLQCETRSTEHGDLSQAGPYCVRQLESELQHNDDKLCALYIGQHHCYLQQPTECLTFSGKALPGKHSLAHLLIPYTVYNGVI